jgi:hypothetical protein
LLGGPESADGNRPVGAVESFRFDDEPLARLDTAQECGPLDARAVGFDPIACKDLHLDLLP